LKFNNIFISHTPSLKKNVTANSLKGQK